MKSYRILILLLVWLFGCAPNTHHNDRPKDVGGISVPHVIHAAKLGSGALSAYIKIDDGSRNPMTMNTDQTEASFQISDLSVGTHKFQVEFEFDSDIFNIVPLASAQKSLPLVAGGNSLGFAETDYSFPDSDGDSVDNLTELVYVTNPKDPTDTPVIDHSPPTLLVFPTIGAISFGSIDELFLLDPADPQHSIPLDTTISNYTRIPFGSYNSTNKNFYDVHFARLLYFKTPHFYLVDMVKSESTPIPQQLSNANYTEICGNIADSGYVLGVDFFNSNNTRILFQRPIGSCATPAWGMLKLGMTYTDSPIDIAADQISAALINTADGSMNGWLGIIGGNLAYFPPDFDNTIYITSTTTITNIYLLGNLPNGKVVLDIVNLNADSKHTLHIYDTETKYLSNNLSPATGSFNYSISDNDYMFFEFNKKIYRLNLNDPGTPSVAYTEDAGAAFLGVFQTDNYVLYHITSGGSRYIKYFAKNATLPTSPQNALIDTVDNQITLIGSSKSWIYFNKLAYNIEATAIALNFSSEGLKSSTYSGNQWISTPTISSAFPGQFALPGVASIKSLFAPEYVILAGYDETQIDYKVGGKNLESYRAQNGLYVTNLGVLPADVMRIDYFPAYMGSRILATAQIGVDMSGEGPHDIIYVDAATENSLVRATNTRDKDEYGCTINPKPKQIDPLLILMLVVSIVYLTRRKQCKQRQKT